MTGADVAAALLAGPLTEARITKASRLLHPSHTAQFLEALPDVIQKELSPRMGGLLEKAAADKAAMTAFALRQREAKLKGKPDA